MTARSRTLADKHHNIGVGRNKTTRQFFGISNRDEADSQRTYKEEISKIKRGENL
jgi:hypothetical protein